MAELRVYALGAALIQRDGETLTGFVSQKTIALFVYLLCHPYEHPREAIAERFWTETTSEQALKNLRTVLSSLQKQVGEYLQITRQGIAITRANEIYFDVRDFESHLNTAQALQSRPSSPRKLQAELEAAVSQYHGDFLLGLKAENAPELDSWLTLERDRLRSRLAEAQLQLVRVALKRGDYGLGIDHGGRLILNEPYWEEAHRLLMRLHVHANNRAAALRVYENLCVLLSDELDAEPEAETQTLAQHIRAQRLPTQTESALTKTNLPPTPTGRYVVVPHILNAVMEKLDDSDCRLLTLLGIGGVGKTKLAQMVAYQRLEEYQDGVFFVPLDSVTSPDMVLHSILMALKITQPDETRKAYDTLVDHLQPRHCLLILDNFEHVLPAAGEIARLSAACPYLQIMTTSREQLALDGEHLLQLVGMPYDQNHADSPALQLFELTALRVNPAFQMETHLSAIRHICELVDGLPLGIVIAASWMQFLPPEDIVVRIQASLDFLTITRHDLPDRHRGVMALLHSTWATMDADERRVMQALSAFPGHFDVDAAQAVAGADLFTIARLVSKSLLQPHLDGRYHLHELLRRFTAQQAAESGLSADARRAHHHYYRGWVDRLYAAYLPSHVQLGAIDLEYHNLWSFEGMSAHEQHHHIITLAKVLPDYWFARGHHLQEGIARLREALPVADGWLKANAAVRFGRLLAKCAHYVEARDVLMIGLPLTQAAHDPILEALALAELNCAIFALGELEAAQAYLVRMTDLYEQTSERDVIALREVFARAYSNLAVTYLQMSDLEQAERYALIGLEKHRESSNPVGEALSLNTLGIIALDTNQFETARGHFSSALTIAYRIDHKRYQTLLSGNLAESLYRMGDFDNAFQMYIQTLHRAALMGNRKTMLNVLEQLANVALDREDAIFSARLLGMALAMRDVLGAAIPPRQMQEYADRKASLSDMLGEEGLESLVRAGRTMTVEALLDEFRPYMVVQNPISDF